MAKQSTEVPATAQEPCKEELTAMKRAMILLDEVDSISPEAIEEMKVELARLTKNLIRLGHDPNRKLGISKVNCRVCNSPDHDARFHKGESSAQKEKQRKAAFG
jgi:hypothetical protein